MKGQFASTEQCQLMQRNFFSAKAELDAANLALPAARRLRLVRVGERADGRVAIMAGLKAGETVVVSPSADLENGSPVSPQPLAVRAEGAGRDNG